MNSPDDLADTDRPRLSPGARLHIDPVTAKPVLLFPEALVELTGSGPAVLPLCDGARTLGDIVDTLARQFKAPPAVIRADVLQLLSRLHDRMLIEWTEQSRAVSARPSSPGPAGPLPFLLRAANETSDGRLEQKRSEPTGSADVGRADTARLGYTFPHRPLGLIAELTYRCPLHCPYCSNPIHLRPGAAELSTDDWKRVLSEAADLGVLHALFSGGEPLIRADLQDIIAHARAVGLYTNLITSGLGLTADRAAKLRAAGLDAVQISFQSDDADQADAIAGTTAHGRKLLAAQAVTDAGFPLTVNVVLHRLNIDRIENIVALAERLGARRLELASAQYYGWAMRNRTALLPTRDQVETASRHAAAARQRLRNKMDVLYVIPDYVSDRPKPCMNGWGRQYISVTPIGDVLPCPTAGDIPSLPVDNVINHDLQWIWEHSRAFNLFRGTDWMPSPCRTCDRRDIDFGGCRCQAALVTGDPANTDPVCTLSPHRGLIDAALTAGAATTPFNQLTFRRNPTPIT